jgi:REG-2-like HAD superfamily hydrolase
MPIGTTPLEAIVFDAVGTLIHPARPVAVTYAAIGARHGLSLSVEEVEARFQAAFKAACWTPVTQATHRTAWRGIVASVFRELDDVTPLFHELWDYFASPEAWSAYDDVAATWCGLRQAGLRLAIASNFDDRFRRLCQAPALIPSSADVFWSVQLGAAKPDQRFFHAISERLGLAAHELLMVGDNLEEDVIAARRAGWNAVWIGRTVGGDVGETPLGDLRQLLAGAVYWSAAGR